MQYKQIHLVKRSRVQKQNIVTLLFVHIVCSDQETSTHTHKKMDNYKDFEIYAYRDVHTDSDSPQQSNWTSFVFNESCFFQWQRLLAQWQSWAQLYANESEHDVVAGTMTYVSL